MAGKPRYEESRNQWTIKIGGKRKYLCSGAGNEALAWRKAGELTRDDRVHERPRSVVQAVDLWLKLKGSREYEWCLAPFMCWAVGISLDGIPEDFLADYFFWLRKIGYQRGNGERKAYAPSTLRKQVRFARTVLVWAHRRGWTDRPAPSLPPLPRRTTVDRAIPRDKLERVLRQLPGTCHPLIVFILLTGCRPSEACRLTWDEVRDGYCELRRGKTWERTGEARIIPLSPEAEQVIAEQTRRGHYVFVNREGNPYRPNGVRSILRRAGERVGVAVTGAYQLRHTWAMNAVETLSMDVVGAALGHRPGSPETRVYARLSRVRVQREVRSLAPVVPIGPPRADRPDGDGTDQETGPRRRGRNARGRKGRAGRREVVPTSDTDVPSSG